MQAVYDFFISHQNSMSYEGANEIAKREIFIKKINVLNRTAF